MTKGGSESGAAKIRPGDERLPEYGVARCKIEVKKCVATYVANALVN